jgi:hypothetical protein
VPIGRDSISACKALALLQQRARTLDDQRSPPLLAAKAPRTANPPVRHIWVPQRMKGKRRKRPRWGLAQLMRPAKAASDVSFVCLPLCYPPNAIVQRSTRLLDPVVPCKPPCQPGCIKKSAPTRSNVKLANNVIRSQRGGPMTALSIVIWFNRAFRNIGLKGCSSHSGRRTFVTRAARMVHKAGGSLRDVQLLAGHRSIQTTQRYIDGDSDAQRKLISMI